MLLALDTNDDPEANLELAWLLIPALATLIAVPLAMWFCRRFGKRIDTWLAVSKRRRRYAGMVFTGLQIIGLTISIEAANFSEMFSGNITWRGVWATTALGILAVTVFAVESLLRFHEEEWQDRVDRLENECQLKVLEAETASKIVKSDRDFVIASNRVFLERIDGLTKRVLDTVEPAENREVPIGIPGLVNALAPNLMVQELVMTAYHIFHQQMIHEHGTSDRKIRVALFRVNSHTNRLEHVFSYNGSSTGCVQSPLISPDRFALTSDPGMLSGSCRREIGRSD